MHKESGEVCGDVFMTELRPGLVVPAGCLSESRDMCNFSLSPIQISDEDVADNLDWYMSGGFGDNAEEDVEVEDIFVDSRHFSSESARDSAIFFKKYCFSKKK